MRFEERHQIFDLAAEVFAAGVFAPYERNGGRTAPDAAK